MEEIKKRGRKKKVITDIPETSTEEKKVHRKRGRKPSNKQPTILEENSYYNTFDDAIVCKVKMSLEDQEKIFGSEETKTEIEVEKNDIETAKPFEMEEENINDLYKKKIKENKKLKQMIENLKKELKNFNHLEKIYTDNGTIKKAVHITNLNLVNDNDSSWKTETNRWCDYCCHSFETIPVGLPEHYNVKTNTFHTIGCFCSFNCAASYNAEIKDNKIWERLALLQRIKNKIFKDTKNKEIIRSPPRNILKVFGGDYEIDEYRGSFLTIPKKYKENFPPTIPIFGTIKAVKSYLNENTNVISESIERFSNFN